MECPGLMGREAKEGLQVRRETRVRKESRVCLVRRERKANHPTMSLSKVLQVLQDPLAHPDRQVLRAHPESGTTEPTSKLLR